MISVVVPIYNKSKTITRCLESVVSQSLTPGEIILVDDGSSDNSLIITKNWIKKNAQNIPYKLISQGNRGVAYSRNKGIEIAKYEYIALIDADDYWQSDFLINMKMVIEQFPNIALATCKHEIEDPEIGKFTPKQFFGLESLGVFNNYPQLARKYPIVNSSKVVLNKKYVDILGGFPNGVKVSEDLFLWIRLSQLAPFGYCDKTLVTIYQERDKSRNSRTGEIPYPILYFSQPNERIKLTKDLKKFLWSVHKKHVLGSCHQNKHEALKRILAGIKLFKLKGSFLLLLMLPPKTFYRKLRRLRRHRQVLINEIK